MTYFRALCAELVEAWDSTADFDFNDFGHAAADIVTRARAALAEASELGRIQGPEETHQGAGEMTDQPLSPAAQAVLDAVASQMEGGWISPDFIPYEARKIAAALRAAAPLMEFFQDHLKLLAIAAELEGNDD